MEGAWVNFSKGLEVFDGRIVSRLSYLFDSTCRFLVNVYTSWDYLNEEKNAGKLALAQMSKVCELEDVRNRLTLLSLLPRLPCSFPCPFYILLLLVLPSGPFSPGRDLFRGELIGPVLTGPQSARCISPHLTPFMSLSIYLRWT